MLVPSALRAPVPVNQSVRPFRELRNSMADQYECPNCRQPLPFGNLTDACPKCATAFGHSSPFRPALTQEQPVAHSPAYPDPHSSDPLASLLESSGASSLIKKIFRAIQVALGVLLLLLAVLLSLFAHGLHLESHDRADLYIPGILAFIGICLIFARGKATTIAARVMGAVAVAFIWFIVLLVGAAAFSR